MQASLLPTPATPVSSLSCTPGSSPTPPHAALLGSHAHSSKRPRPLRGHPLTLVHVQYNPPTTYNPPTLFLASPLQVTPFSTLWLRP